MAATPRLQELIDWLSETVEPLQGQNWSITLNSNGTDVEAKATVVESKRHNERGHTMTISKVTTARFRIADHRYKRKVFITD